MKSSFRHLFASARNSVIRRKAPVKPGELMKSFQYSRFIYRCLTSLGLASTLLLFPSQPKATAEVTSFGISVLKDGTGPFVSPDPTYPGSNNAGNDANDTNGIVRTYDTITYGVNYATNQQPNVSTSYKLTITDDHHLWDENQTECAGNITISADRKTLTCSEVLPSSTTGLLKFTAFVLGTAPHEASLKVEAVIQADGKTINAGPTDTKVSATPKMDLVKDRPAKPRRDGTFKAGPNGEEGVVYVWPLSVVAPKGSEMLSNPITITDVVSGISPNARLYNWGGRNGCAPNTNDGGNDPTDLGERIGELPYGSTNIANASQQDRAVGDSGTWTCTQNQPGEDIEIIITGADLSGRHRPSLNSNGGTLNADEIYLIAGGVEIWIPTSDFPAGGNQLTVTNSYNFLDTLSITSQTNVEPDKGSNNNVPLSDTDNVNNDRQFTLERPVPGAGQSKEYRTPYDGGSFNPRLLYPMTERRSGDGVVMPEQVFGGYFIMNNSGSGDLSNAMVCDKFDNRTQILAPHPTTGKYVQIFEFDNNRLDESEVIIEYGVGGDNASDSYYGDETAPIGDTARYNAQRNATCGDSDATWYSEAQLTSELIPRVTRVRIRPSATNGVLGENRRLDGVVHLKALNIDPVTGDRIPDLNILANHVTSRADDINSGNWRNGNYRPENHGGNDDGDRLRLTRGIVRVDKKTDNPNNSTEADDSINSVKASENITFVLESTLTAFVNNAPAANIVLTDTLPAELSYVFGSANIAPTSVTENNDGTTTLVWELGNRVPNETIPSINFQATAGFDIAGGTSVTNTAVITALDGDGQPLDSSSEDLRTDTRSIVVSNSAAFNIFKEAVNPEINLGDDIVYDLYFANLSDNIDVAPGSKFIDILPYEGDSGIRNQFDGAGTPPTDYTATPIFKSIVDLDNVGFSFEYTNDTPSNINDNPETQNSSTKWCTQTQIDNNEADCPLADLSDVTAIQITAPEIKAGDPTRKLRLTMNSAGSLGSDVYTNNFKGTPNHPSLGFIPSVDATVRTPPAPVDYGDAPTTYGNPSHIVPNTPTIYLGSTIPDSETNPQLGDDAGVGADGDDNNGTDDEDGISSFPSLTAGAKDYNIPADNITVNGTGTLHAWIDFNKNNTFEAEEHTSVAVNNGNLETGLNWSDITIGAEGDTYARFRFTSDASVTSSTPSGSASDGEVEDYQVAFAAIANNPNILLVKRITKINNGTTTNNGDNLAIYNQEDSNPYDDNKVEITDLPQNQADPKPDTDKWLDTTEDTSSTFLIGGINGGKVEPDDEIEYTIYYLSAGDREANNVLVCDRIPGNVSFIPNSFNNEANQATGGPQNADRGIQWLKDGNTESLTNAGDGDVAQYFPPGVEPSSVYPQIKCGGTNTNGAVVVNLGDLPGANSDGVQLDKTYGFIRFRGRVK
ncbi:hypothetical protein NIES267_16810 [Calothrix parasitica NIES-267]|uniref:GEVED domain-containing protein n=1 Tax=Calothrix parasitica NIES-267 TaxID=1973488 RepID=A0A1Z4LLU2_9CYAN|nr:hypothetical protein NIES267_16810 [Calothrix parasitica NIES-267]